MYLFVHIPQSFSRNVNSGIQGMKFLYCARQLQIVFHPVLFFLIKNSQRNYIFTDPYNFKTYLPLMFLNHKIKSF